MKKAVVVLVAAVVSLATAQGRPNSTSPEKQPAPQPQQQPSQPKQAPPQQARAYDKKSGKELGAVYMPAGQTGTPMTYMRDGKQYIVIAIAGNAYPAELLAFRLPSP